MLVSFWPGKAALKSLSTFVMGSKRGHMLNNPAKTGFSKFLF